MTTQEAIINTLDPSYSELFSAVHTGSDEDVLAALSAMVDACPEVESWLARAVGSTTRDVRRCLSWTGDAQRLGEYDPGDADLFEMEDILDAAAMYGTLDEALIDLCDSDPRAGQVITFQYGLDGQGPKKVKDISTEMGFSRETVRRYSIRGRMKIQKRLAARGLVTK